MTSPLHKSDFPIFHNNPDLVFLDSAASTQKPRQVLSIMTDFYEKDYANVHRGTYDLSIRASQEFETARQVVASHFGAKEHEIIFAKNATEAMNIVAFAMLETLKEGDKILISVAEHHSNFITWHTLAEKAGAELIVVPLDDKNKISLQNFERFIDEDVKLVAITHMSNVTGQVVDVQALCKTCNEKNIPVLVDGTQAAAHLEVNVKNIGATFYVCSAHKLYGPTGIGMLYMEQDTLASFPTVMTGGGMIETAAIGNISHVTGPQRFEAGTPPFVEAIGFARALKYIKDIGYYAIKQQDFHLTHEAHEKLGSIDGMKFFSDEESAGIVAFTIDGVHSEDLAQFLAQKNICVRTGKHCAHPFMTALNTDTLVRASFGLYNSSQDIDALVAALKEAVTIYKK